MTVRRFTCDNPDYDLWDDSHGTFVRYDDYERLYMILQLVYADMMDVDDGMVANHYFEKSVKLLKKELEG